MIHGDFVVVDRGYQGWGLCHRYPDKKEKHCADWCGEFYWKEADKNGKTV